MVQLKNRGLPEVPLRWCCSAVFPCALTPTGLFPDLFSTEPQAGSTAQRSLADCSMERAHGRARQRARILQLSIIVTGIGSVYNTTLPESEHHRRVLLDPLHMVTSRGGPVTAPQAAPAFCLLVVTATCGY